MNSLLLRAFSGLLLFVALTFVGACSGSLPISKESSPELQSDERSGAADLDSGSDRGDAPDATVAEDTGASSVEVRQGGGIEYSLVWDWSGATREQGTGKWRFVTSKGVEFRLSAVYSHISVLQLVPCEKTSSSTPGAANWFGRTMQWLTLGVALAEHAYDNDSSWLARLVVERWFRESPRLFGKGTASGARVCKLHTLYTPSNRKAEDGFTMPSKSLWWTGEYRIGSDAPWKSLKASIHLEQGALVPLEVPVSLTKQPQTGIKVELVRSPVKAFDSLQPDSSEPIDLAYSLLRRLGQTSTAKVSSLP